MEEEEKEEEEEELKEKPMSHEAKASRRNKLGSTIVWSQHFTSTNPEPPRQLPTSTRRPPPVVRGFTVGAQNTSGRSALSVTHWSMSSVRASDLPPVGGRSQLRWWWGVGVSAGGICPS